MVLKLEISRYFEGMVGSKLPFLNRGRTCAVLKEAGNIACEKDKLVSLEIIGAEMKKAF